MPDMNKLSFNEGVPPGPGINKKKLVFWILVSILILSAFFLPIEIPYSIKTPGKIIPAKEWIVIKGTDGRVITMLKNNLKGSTETYTVSQFERGDAINFELKPEIIFGSFVSENDTVAKIYSNEIERQYIQLKGDLNVAFATLKLNKSGEKSSVIDVEKKQLEYKKKQAEEYKKQLNRIELLYKKNMVSQEEYEIAKSTDELNEINIKISEAHLQSIVSGSKPEQINYINEEISSLRDQLDVLQKRLENYILVSKVSGIVNQMYSGDTILVVSDTTDLLVISPVKWSDRKYISEDQTVFVNTSGSQTSQAVLYKREKQVKQLNRQQAFLVLSRVTEKNADLVPGLFVQCTVQCNPVSPYEYLKRLLDSTL